VYKFEPILKQVIWGGERIAAFKRLDTEMKEVGESWELSSVPGNLSVVAEGPDKGLDIVQLLRKYRDRLVGYDNYVRYGDMFPLLIKFIDAHRALSVQVHPDDVLAKERHGTWGKSEMWYVIDADREAKICAGLSQSVTKEDYVRMVAEGTIEEVLHYERAHTGDVYFLPAGRVHSLGAGCLVAEIQQTSDITYRIFDYNRRDNNGNLRELHTELAEEAIDYQVLTNAKVMYESRMNEPVPLVEDAHFVTSLYELTEPMECDYSELDSFIVYVGLEGEIQLVDDEGRMMTLRAGEVVLVPASTQTVVLLPEGKGKLLEVFA